MHHTQDRMVEVWEKRFEAIDCGEMDPEDYEDFEAWGWAYEDRSPVEAADVEPYDEPEAEAKEAAE